MSCASTNGACTAASPPRTSRTPEVALIDDPTIAKKILRHLGRATELPKLTPARAPLQPVALTRA